MPTRRILHIGIACSCCWASESRSTRTHTWQCDHCTAEFDHHPEVGGPCPYVKCGGTLHWRPKA